jgi:alpha-L-rhamnosidase
MPVALGFFGPARLRRRTALHRAVEIEHADGCVTRIVSDDVWRTLSGEIVYSDQQMGETVDARRRKTGWDRAVSTRTRLAGGHPCSTGRAAPGSGARARIAAQIDLHPISVGEPTPGAFIFDMGQNRSAGCA